MSQAEGQQQHPLTIYLWIWLLLFVLSACSYAVDYFHLQGMLRWTLIIIFMLLKAGFIVAIFMHMAWERLALKFAILLPPLVPAHADRLHGDRGRLHLHHPRDRVPAVISWGVGPVIREADFVQSVADALQFISYYHPADYIAHLGRAYAREQSPAAKDAIAQILTNSRMCAEGKRPICQDTGIVNVFVKAGMGVRWDTKRSPAGDGRRGRAARLRPGR